MQITNVNFALGGMNVQTWDPPPYVPPSQYLWSWGRNNFGQLGLGNTISRSSPVQVGALTTWISVSLSGGSLGIRGSATRGAMFALRS